MKKILIFSIIVCSLIASENTMTLKEMENTKPHAKILSKEEAKKLIEEQRKKALAQQEKEAKSPNQGKTPEKASLPLEQTKERQNENTNNNKTAAKDSNKVKIEDAEDKTHSYVKKGTKPTKMPDAAVAVAKSVTAPHATKPAATPQPIKQHTTAELFGLAQDKIKGKKVSLSFSQLKQKIIEQIEKENIENFDTQMFAKTKLSENTLKEALEAYVSLKEQK